MFPCVRHGENASYPSHRVAVRTEWSHTHTAENFFVGGTPFAAAVVNSACAGRSRCTLTPEHRLREASSLLCDRERKCLKEWKGIGRVET